LYKFELLQVSEVVMCVTNRVNC